MKPDIDYTLCLVTDRTLMAAPTIEDLVEQAVRGGCTLVQLREKMASSREFYDMVVKVRAVTARLGVPLIINDRVDIALAAGADGVHVGQEDVPAKAVRRLIGPDKILGVSATTLDEALAAQEAGADYLGVGAMFPTGTKTDGDFATMEELGRIRKAVTLPIVVIGGINKQTVPLFSGTGIDGLAVVSAIASQPDAVSAARELIALFQQGREKEGTPCHSPED